MDRQKEQKKSCLISAAIKKWNENLWMMFGPFPDGRTENVYEKGVL